MVMVALKCQNKGKGKGKGKGNVKRKEQPPIISILCKFESTVVLVVTVYYGNAKAEDNLEN